MLKLNKQSFSAEDLSESSYYKKWGPVSLRLKKEIEAGIKAKFNETSDILDQFDWGESAADYFFYAMLKKDFKFAEPFSKVGEGPFLRSTKKVQYFGAESFLQKKSVWVLFYKDSSEYAVRLQSKQGDHIYL